MLRDISVGCVFGDSFYCKVCFYIFYTHQTMKLHQKPLKASQSVFEISKPVIILRRNDLWSWRCSTTFMKWFLNFMYFKCSSIFLFDFALRSSSRDTRLSISLPKLRWQYHPSKHSSAYTLLIRGTITGNTIVVSCWRRWESPETRVRMCDFTLLWCEKERIKNGSTYGCYSYLCVSSYLEILFRDLCGNCGVLARYQYRYLIYTCLWSEYTQLQKNIKIY